MEKLFSVYEKSGAAGAPTQRLSIYRTVSPENPREIFDNYWTLFCQHPRLKVGDERKFGSLEELKDWKKKRLWLICFNIPARL